MTNRSAIKPSVSEGEWLNVCAIDEVLPGAGLAVDVAGEQIAIVRTRSGHLFAVSNFDPFSQAFVIARGLVDEDNGAPQIVSPIYQQSFSLETGKCRQDESVRLTVYAIRVSAGRIQVARLVRSPAS